MSQSINPETALNTGRRPGHPSEGVSSAPHGPRHPAPDPHFVVISKFIVANGMTSQVKEAFRNRPHKVDGADGFLHMEVISPVDNPDEIWLITAWRDEVSFRTWHHSHLYREAHEGIPKGLKLVPKSAGIRCFEGISK